MENEQGQAPAPAGQAPAQTTEPKVSDNTQSQPLQSDWSTQIPAELKTEKIWESFKGKQLSDVLKSTVEAHKMVGGSIRLPSDKDTPTERAKKLEDIAKKLGRPESWDKYTSKTDLPEYVGWDEQFDVQLKQAAHSVGMTDGQLGGMYKFLGGYLQKTIPNPVKAKAETETVLREEWGDLKYPRNLEYANRALTHWFGDSVVEKLAKAGLSNDPDIIKGFAKLGLEGAEAGVIDGKIDGMGTSTEVKAEIDAILSDKTDVYHSQAGTPGRKERIEHVQNLWKLLE